MRFNTKAIHAGINSQNNRHATTIPLYNSSSFTFNSPEDMEKAFEGRHPGYIYSRISNPTVTAFEQRMAALENGIASFATASGMAAIHAVFITLAETNSEVVIARSLFGGTQLYLRSIAKQMGVHIKTIDFEDIQAVKRAITKNTRFLFAEIIGNPKLDIPNIPELAQIAREYNTPLVVDATVASPALFQGKQWMASVVLHSTTKAISGNGTIIGGVVTDLATFDWSTHAAAALKNFLPKTGRTLSFISALRHQGAMNAGLIMSPFVAYQSAIGLETLGLRMKQHVYNANTLAGWLQQQPQVKQVHHPDMKNSPYYHIAQTLLPHGSGGLLTFSLHNKNQCFHFLRKLKIAARATNLGDAKTLVLHPATTIFHDSTEEEKAFSGVHDGMLRVSVGIENIEDIQEDFAQALQGVQQ